MLLILLPLIVSALEEIVEREMVCLEKAQEEGFTTLFNQFCEYNEDSTVFSYVNREVNPYAEQIYLSTCDLDEDGFADNYAF